MDSNRKPNWGGHKTLLVLTISITGVGSPPFIPPFFFIITTNFPWSLVLQPAFLMVLLCHYWHGGRYTD
jgi:hypothetical protein